MPTDAAGMEEGKDGRQRPVRRGEMTQPPVPEQPEELFPQLDPLEVERTFKHEFSACRDLLALAWARKPTQSTEAWHFLLMAIFARATLSYRAVMQLCRGGYGEQADMLNRSLFEDMAAAHWLSMNGQTAVERIEQHHQHNRLLWNRVLERRSGLGEAVDLRLSDQAVAELDQMFGKHGHRPWTGLSMFNLVSEIEQLWPDVEGREQLWRFFELAHRAKNQKLHLTSFALNRTVRAREEDGETTFQYRASPDASPEGPVPPALYGAFWIFWQLAGLMFDTFEIPQDELTQLVKRHIRAFAETSGRWSQTYGSPEPE